ncbi:hypothetical protein [Sphingosinicella terrae]|uniref:hypothetical protein n=1 Tax=Sphingosinicella terrae TaxID=2172047 RepID=UPI0013B38ED7|nr:hypothetical protein [Sphingosinicella terrae]
MRLLPLAFLLSLAGCAGNVADYVGDRTAIVGPELARYGLDAEQTRCVGARLTAALTPLQLRRLTRTAASVQQSYFGADRLELRDLMHVATTMSDPQIRLELARATEGCGIGAPPPVAEVSPPPPPGTPAERPAEWLNLGSAPTGQSIAVDAATLEREPSARRAWFRLTNPDQPADTGISYLLRIDCTGRTIEALGHRRQDAAGATTEFREYARDSEGPLAVEGGTVMEIAFLALCT